MSWFAAKTKYKGEFKALDFFSSIGVNSYVPSYTTKRIWTDRIKKIRVPAITGYVFFELNRVDFNLINLNPFTKNIVRDIDGMPAVIKNKEITTLKDYFSGKLIACNVNLVQGQRVKINKGPFIF